MRVPCRVLRVRHAMRAREVMRAASQRERAAHTDTRTPYPYVLRAVRVVQGARDAGRTSPNGAADRRGRLLVRNAAAGVSARRPPLAGAARRTRADEHRC